MPSPKAGMPIVTEELKGLWAALGEYGASTFGGLIDNDGKGIPPGPPVQGLDATDKFAPLVHQLMEQSLRGTGTAILSNLRSNRTKDGSGAVWNYALYKYTATFEQAPGGDPTLVKITNNATANEDHKPPTDDTIDHGVSYVYIIGYDNNGAVVTIPPVPPTAPNWDWISVGGNAAFTPAYLKYITKAVWNTPNYTSLTEANVRKIDAANP